MKKMLVLAGSALALGLLVGCEDKQAELQQNQRIDAVSSELNRMKSDIEQLQNDNRELRGKITLVTDWLRKKVEEEKAKALKEAEKKTTTTSAGTKTGVTGAKTGSTTGSKTSDPKKKMFP